jgi:hypothetical protein
MEEACVRPPSALVAFPASSSSWSTFPSSSRLVRDVRRLLFRREDGPRLVTRDNKREEERRDYSMSSSGELKKGKFTHV